MGTTANNAPVYGNTLKALLAPPPPFETHVDDSQLKDLYKDYPFNWAVNLAITRLGDAGLIVDIHHFRMTYPKLKALKRENERLNHIIGALQKEQEAHTQEIQQFIDGIQEIKERLTATRVMSQITPLLQRMAVEGGMIWDSIYPQLYHAPSAAPVEHTRPPTPHPPLHPTNPEPPSASSSVYALQTPTPEMPRPLSPPGPGIPADSLQTPVLLIPPWADYSATRRGPHHQPTPFNSEQSNFTIWPPLLTQPPGTMPATCTLPARSTDASTACKAGTGTCTALCPTPSAASLSDVWSWPGTPTS